jgi:hypothetical protein
MMILVPDVRYSAFEIVSNEMPILPHLSVDVDSGSASGDNPSKIRGIVPRFIRNQLESDSVV